MSYESDNRKKAILVAAVAALLFLTPNRPIRADVGDVCGDAFITGSEVCDDFNAVDGDGCSADCSTLEPGWFCFEFDVGFFTFCTSICGDGLQVGFEACDDGNSINGDGCDDNAAAGGFCVPTGCGNGVYTPESGEACDDFNAADGDGCSSTCAVESGWVCDSSFGFSLCNTVCGDHIFAGAEQCEDGNGINGDGCDDDVLNAVSPGNCTFTACGNLVQTEGEDCDDGNTIDADGETDFCDSNCRFPGCGNGVVDHIESQSLDEACDDGNHVNGDGCDNNCTVSGCGNGILAGDEICDDGNTDNDDGCSADCRPECGDGVLGVNEGCDDGNIRSGDGCSGVCTVEGPVGVCGNGVLEAGEECDDGDQEGGCEADCTDQRFESANPTLVFKGLVVGDNVILNSPDPRDSSSAPVLESALVLPPDCDCTWSISPLALGHFSSATECQTQLILDRDGDGVLKVETDCGADGSGTFLQNLVVNPRPVPENGGCGLIPRSAGRSF